MALTVAVPLIGFDDVYGARPSEPCRAGRRTNVEATFRFCGLRSADKLPNTRGLQRPGIDGEPHDLIRASASANTLRTSASVVVGSLL
jgi:hypothetical protein